MAVKICPASTPPPVASNPSVASVSVNIATRSAIKLGDVEFSACWAPMPFSNSTCSSFRTILTSGTLSFRQIFTNIWPRFEAAAVCTRAVWPSWRMVSTIPRAVSGFTKQLAPSLAVTPSFIGKHWLTFIKRYSEYMAPPKIATVLPISA